MTEDNKEHAIFIGKSVEVAVRIGLIGLLVAWSFLIIRAFIDPVLWGVIIAIGFYPLHQKLAAIMGNREKLAALLLTILALAVLMVPTVLLTDSTISGIEKLKGNIENGTLTIPAPSDKVAGWPFIGKPIDRFWSMLVSMSDTFLKPLLLGRGVEVPMLVVLLGAIGGMLMSGIIGLFIGPVVLSITYKIFCSWIHNDANQLQQPDLLTPEPENLTPET